MQENRQIVVLGGDQRQITVVDELKKKGYQIATWGLPDGASSWEELVSNTDLILTGLPATSDGIHLYAPLHKGAPLKITSLLQRIEGKCLIAGKLTSEWCLRAKEKNITCIDYFEGESLQIQNALPSAEGAIFLAMQELPVILSGTQIAILGFGRIGKLLAQKLSLLNAKVTVYARRKEVLAEADTMGMTAKELNREALIDIPPDTRILFNTVPHILLDAEILKYFPPKCIYIELASFPGGIDLSAAQKHGIYVRPGGGLPGKYAPESAGCYLAEAIDALISQRQ